MIRQQQFNIYTKHLSFWHRMILSQTLSKLEIVRNYFGNEYLSGNGVEIGAQYRPIRVTNPNIRIKYIDRISREKTSEIYGLPVDILIEPDYYLEADNLHIFSNDSLDFIIANHVLEHMEDPLGTIAEWLRVVKENGILFITIPNYRSNEYDFRRKPANLEHLISDYENSSISKRQMNRIEHYREFIANVMDLEEDDPDFEKNLKDYIDRDERTHFHVYNPNLLEQMFNFVHNELGIRIQIIDTFCFDYSFEILVILRKSGLASKHPQLQFRLIKNSSLLLYFVCSDLISHYIRTFLKAVLWPNPVWRFTRARYKQSGR